MKKINKKKLYPIIVAVCIILVFLITFVLSDKNLDLESNQVTSLYKYLGEVDVYHCGGLNAYSDEEVNKDDISSDNALCMAYYGLSTDQIKSDTVESSGVNKNDIKICKVGESTTLATNEEEEHCEYKTFNKNDLNSAYKEIYGEKIDKFDKFYISSTEACYLEGDTYYCGTAETFTYSLTPAATVYRLMNKAVKKLNGDIVIYDYFLKVSDNKCYSLNDSTEENKDCTKALADNEIDADFVKKYGSIYKHTFKESDNSYYWAKSNLK